MNRTILEACLPCVGAIAVAFVLFVVIARLGGANWNWNRFRVLHRSEEGGVQSLAFVLTLPLLVMILLFIVQVSQLMLGIMTVNYAAFATARAAIVWIPTWVPGEEYAGESADEDGQNELPPGIEPGIPVLINQETINQQWSEKYEKIWTAAVLACAPAAPSRQTPDGAATGFGPVADAAYVMKQMYADIVPASTANDRIPRRIDNKVTYSGWNTHVSLMFEDRNSQPVDGTNTYNPIDHELVPYFPSEVGWQDPITVTVYHDFALLPGPGRFLAKLLVRSDGKEDRVAPRIRQQSGIYKTRIYASATLTNEGIKSIRPYDPRVYP